MTNTDWRWWRFRYIILPNDKTWNVFDCTYGRAVVEGLPLLDAYREAIKLNEMEKQHGKQYA